RKLQPQRNDSILWLKKSHFTLPYNSLYQVGLRIMKYQINTMPNPVGIKDRCCKLRE
ncbi:MAG: hypothetical protein ACI82Z_000782, partial [Cellvibrionaceae bacterium]